MYAISSHVCFNVTSQWFDIVTYALPVSAGVLQACPRVTLS
jgi:hypothetical protein